MLFWIWFFASGAGADGVGGLPAATMQLPGMAAFMAQRSAAQGVPGAAGGSVAAAQLKAAMARCDACSLVYFFQQELFLAEKRTPPTVFFAFNLKIGVSRASKQVSKFHPPNYFSQLAERAVR